MKREHAERIAAMVCDLLEGHVGEAIVCGSFRRGEQIVGDLDVVLLRPDRRWLAEQPWITVAKKTARAEVRGLPVEFIFIDEARSRGAAVLHATGPGDLNEHLRRRAKTRGQKLNQYGLWWRRSGDFVAGRTEEEIYLALGLEPQEPECRNVGSLRDKQ